MHPPQRELRRCEDTHSRARGVNCGEHVSEHASLNYSISCLNDRALGQRGMGTWVE